MIRENTAIKNRINGSLIPLISLDKSKDIREVRGVIYNRNSSVFLSRCANVATIGSPPTVVTKLSCFYSRRSQKELIK